VIEGRRPPRLLVKTLAVTFATAALLLVAVFIVVTVSVRDQVRQAVVTNLESSQRIFAAIETRRQRELSEQVAALAESPRLKAAVDTYAAESKTNTDAGVREQWLTTIRRQLEEVAADFDIEDGPVLVNLADLERNARIRIPKFSQQRIRVVGLIGEYSRQVGRENFREGVAERPQYGRIGVNNAQCLGVSQ